MNDSDKINYGWHKYPDEKPVLCEYNFNGAKDYIVYVNCGDYKDLSMGEYSKSGWDRSYVTHWMELPAPPKEDNE